ncbi:hypothetical protein F2Q70_00016284 [Brassica cretica]|uniref:Uncharacterized protein n=1 Tax=Brassica cretica TaxID=69181 RepID=A0A8S9KPV9_BRACR|nr:hypothetical protein F2Q70_00016284 [Brassica cretica]KAF2595777.1 hypothetical protein F2Q68_00009264 [Brassica cretica]
MSFPPMVFNLLLSFIWLLELAFLVLRVLMFPLIGYSFPVCGSQTIAGVYPSTFEFGDVFPVIEIHPVNIQSIGFCSLALQVLRFNDYFQSVKRVLEQLWPPPGFLYSGNLFYLVTMLSKGWATGSLDKENKGKLVGIIFAIKERLNSASWGSNMETPEDNTKTSMISLRS